MSIHLDDNSKPNAVGLSAEVEALGEVQKRIEEAISTVHRISDRISPRSRENKLHKLALLGQGGHGLLARIVDRRGQLNEALDELFEGLAEIEGSL